MKFVKLSIFALTMGLFIASCGGNTEAEAPAEDTAAMAAPVEPTPAPVADTATAAPATDSAAAAAAPAAH
ncbi:hypothetical protein CAP35_03020 [Chitinophagaceae bacterium IBVUCB1]|nr:hypothetical protein CAP35_03020 [Chitinophagaceae bacterium IBVUCB1]